MRKSRTITAEIEKIDQRLAEIQPGLTAANEKLEASRLEFVGGRMAYDDYKAVGAEHLDVTKSADVLRDAKKELQDELAEALASEHDASKITAVRQAIGRSQDAQADYLLSRQRFEEAARNLAAAKSATTDAVVAVRTAAQVIVPEFVTPRATPKGAREHVRSLLATLGPDADRLHKVFEPEVPVSDFEAAIISVQSTGEAMACRAREKKREAESQARRSAAAVLTEEANQKYREERIETAQRQQSPWRKFDSGLRDTVIQSQ